MDNDSHYISRAWGLLTRDKGWYKAVLTLCAAYLIPIAGPLWVRGYGLEWARLTAWGVDAAPKQKDVNVGECIKSGFRGTLIALAFGFVFGLVFGILGLVPLLGTLVSLVQPILTLALGAFSMAAMLRATIYCNISAGFEVENLWEMVKRKTGGLFYIIATRLIITLPTAILVAIPWVGAFVSRAVQTDLFTYLELISESSNNSYAAAKVIEIFLSVFSHNVPLIVFTLVVATIASVMAELMTSVVAGLWFRNFDVASWGASSDPLPSEPTVGSAYPQLPPASGPYTQSATWNQRPGASQQSWGGAVVPGPGMVPRSPDAWGAPQQQGPSQQGPQVQGPAPQSVHMPSQQQGPAPQGQQGPYVPAQQQGMQEQGQQGPAPQSMNMPVQQQGPVPQGQQGPYVPAQQQGPVPQSMHVPGQQNEQVQGSSQQMGSIASGSPAPDQPQMSATQESQWADPQLQNSQWAEPQALNTGWVDAQSLSSQWTVAQPEGAQESPSWESQAIQPQEVQEQEGLAQDSQVSQVTNQENAQEAPTIRLQESPAPPVQVVQPQESQAQDGAQGNPESGQGLAQAQPVQEDSPWELDPISFELPDNPIDAGADEPTELQPMFEQAQDQEISPVATQGEDPQPDSMQWVMQLGEDAPEFSEGQDGTPADETGAASNDEGPEHQVARERVTVPTYDLFEDPIDSASVDEDDEFKPLDELFGNASDDDKLE